jgi:hypothetical protein
MVWVEGASVFENRRLAIVEIGDQALPWEPGI